MRAAFMPRAQPAMNALTLTVTLGAALAAASGAALADRRDSARSAVPPPAAVRQECGSCHVVYPPQLLPAASWQRLMAGLDKHFGSDASLEAGLAREIERWLLAGAAGAAGDGRASRRTAEAPPEDRITRGAWFVREHRKVSPATWALPSVKSAANCQACHPRAEQGDFDEHAVRLPR